MRRCRGKELVLVKLKQQLKKFSRHLFFPPEEGQGLTEYALVLFFIAIVLIAIIVTIGPTVGSTVENVVDFGLS